MNVVGVSCLLMGRGVWEGGMGMGIGLGTGRGGRGGRCVNRRNIFEKFRGKSFLDPFEFLS